MSGLVTAFFLMPLVSVFLCLVFLKQARAQNVIVSISTGLQFLLSIGILSFFKTELPIQLTFGSWPQNYGIGFSLDILSLLLVGVSSLVFFVGSLFSGVEVSKSVQKRYFWIAFGCLQVGVNGSFLTADLFNLFVFFEVLLISALVLIISEGGAVTRKAAGYYLSLNLIGSVFFLFAIGLVYQSIGSLSISEISYRMTLVDPVAQSWIAVLLFGVFASKSALFPFYYWLTHSYPYLPSAIGGVFGGLLTKVGLYCFVRVFLGFFPSGYWIFTLLLLASLLSMLLGVFGAYAKKDVRSILSYHIISQVGYIGGAVALAGLASSLELKALALSASLFYFVHHILVKSNLFFSSSWMRVCFASTELSRLSGLMKFSPILALLFAVPAMSLAGIPPFSGFWAKLGVLKVAFDLGEWLYIACALLAGLFTFLSMLKIWNASFLKPGDDQEKLPIKKRWVFGSGLLVVATLWISFQPGYVFDLCEQAAEQFFQFNGREGR